MIVHWSGVRWRSISVCYYRLCARCLRFRTPKTPSRLGLGGGGGDKREESEKGKRIGETEMKQINMRVGAFVLRIVSQYSSKYKFLRHEPIGQATAIVSNTLIHTRVQSSIKPNYESCMPNWHVNSIVFFFRITHDVHYQKTFIYNSFCDASCVFPTTC